MAVFKCCGSLSLQYGTLLIGIVEAIGCSFQYLYIKNTAVLYISYVICALTIGSLIYGAVQREGFFLISWLVCSIIAAVLIILTMILAFFGIHILAVNSGIGVVISCLIADALKVYFILVVHSFYCELREEGENPRV